MTPRERNYQQSETTAHVLETRRGGILRRSQNVCVSTVGSVYSVRWQGGGTWIRACASAFTVQLLIDRILKKTSPGIFIVLSILFYRLTFFKLIFFTVSFSGYYTDGTLQEVFFSRPDKPIENNEECF